MHCNDTGTKHNHDWKKTLGMIRVQLLEFLKNAGEEEKEKEKEKETSDNEPVQAIHSQDKATENKKDSKDVDDNNNDDIDFTVTNTGIIRDNILGDDDESDEKDMNDINDPSDGKEVVTRGSETTGANDGDEQRQTAATDTRIARNNDNYPSHEKEVVARGSERTDAYDGDIPRETAATDTRIARDDNNDPSDGMEVDTRGSERTNASVCVCVCVSGLRLRMGYTVMHEIPISSPPILMTSLPYPRTQL